MRNEHAVVIAGGGPTGMVLAGELKRAGVDVAIVERRQTQDIVGSRAGGLHARTIELFDQRGRAERFLAEGQVAQVAGFGGATLSIADFPTRHPYGLGLWQNHIERILAQWIAELGVTVHRGRDVAGCTQDGTGVDIALSDGSTMRAQYLVGCDGGRSVVRKSAGIAFPGWDATTSQLIAEVELDLVPELGIRRDAIGMHGIGRVGYEIRDGVIHYDAATPLRVMVTERMPAPRGEPTVDELRDALIAVYGTDYGMRHVKWISRFTDVTRQAESYRDRRILLAGDAAHVHAPDGGQGLNIGVSDAFNLGWKLAQVVNGVSNDTLLDTYHAERHPVGARVLRDTMASVALRRADERTNAVRDVVGELLALDAPRKHLAAALSGLGVHYDLGGTHPLVGRRMPDLDIVTDAGPTRVYAHLHAARPVLIRFNAHSLHDIDAWAARVQTIDAHYDGPWDLPVIGDVDAPKAVLVRPDGYVAWVGEGTSKGLVDALRRWA